MLGESIRIRATRRLDQVRAQKESVGLNRGAAVPTRVDDNPRWPHKKSREAGAIRRSSLQQLRQLGDIGSDPPRLVFSQALVHGPAVRLIVEIDIGELLPAPVGDDEALIVGLDRPGRREAARIHAI